jgi:hypothetical protein
VVSGRGTRLVGVGGRIVKRLVYCGCVLGYFGHVPSYYVECVVLVGGVGGGGHEGVKAAAVVSWWRWGCCCWWGVGGVGGSRTQSL